MGPEFRFPDDGTLLWFPSRHPPEGLVPGRFGMPLVARMAPGATPETVASELNTLARQLPARFGGSAAYARVIDQHRAVVRPLEEEVLGAVARPLWVLLRRGRDRAADRVRQRRQSVHGARRGAPARSGGASRDRRRARSARPAADGGGRRRGGRARRSRRGLCAFLTLPAFLRAAPAGIPRLGDVGVTGVTLCSRSARRSFAALACGARAGAPRVGSRLHAPARRRPRLDAQAALGARRARRRADGARARAAHRIGTARAQLLGAAARRPRLRHEGHLHVSDRARRTASAGRTGLRAFRSRVHGSAQGASWRPVGRTGREHAAERGHGGRPVPRRGHERRSGQRSAAPGDVCRGRLLQDDGHRPARRPSVRDERSPVGAAERGDQPVGRESAVARLEAPSASGCSARLRRAGRRPRSSAWSTTSSRTISARAPKPLVYFPLVGPTPTSWVISSPAYVVKTPRAEHDRGRGPRARARGRAGGADVPRVHDGRAGQGFDGGRCRSRC